MNNLTFLRGGGQRGGFQIVIIVGTFKFQQNRTIKEGLDFRRKGGGGKETVIYKF